MTSSSTPRTVPSSPFFAPSTPSVVVVQQTPGGTRRPVRQKEKVVEHKSGLLGCTSNLINAIVGSGIVGIPFAIKEAGFVAGVLLIILCAVLTEKSLRLLIATAKHVDVPSYETLAEAAFGVAGFRFVAVNMFIMAYGAMLSYLMIVKDSFSALLGVDPDDTAQRRAVLFLVSMLVMVPLASKRDMADLSFTSRLSVLIDSVLVIMVVMNAPVGESLEQEGGWEGMWTHAVHFDTLFVGLGVLSFAFVCQHSAFIIAGSLENPTIARWSIASRSALTLCGILALTCGVAGYTGYLEETQGNILQNLDPTSWTANAARGMLGTTMLFVYPLESFVARHVCVVLLFQGRRAHEGEDSAVLNRRDRRIGLTVALYLIAVIPASIFEDLGFVLALSGAIGGSCLSYIGPGVVFLGVHGERFLKLVSESWLGKMLPSNETSSGNATAKKLHLTEATPLVATTTGDAESGTPEDEKLSKNADEEQPASTLAAALRPIVWYLTAMPCWCAVARFGTSGIQTHAEDMALKSPHPIRIGSVEYRRREAKMGDDIDERPTIVRIDSMPMMPKGRLVNTGKPPKSPGNINQMLGKEILKRQQEAMKQPKEGFEHDPQELPPTWYDFIVAIFFILFGCLALVAGLGSLMHGK